MSSSAYVSDYIKLLEPEINSFLATRPNVKEVQFKNEIITGFDKEFESSNEPRYTLYCLTRKTVKENLPLILFIIGGLILLTFAISKCIMNIINKFKARKIFRKIEAELRAGAFGKNIGYRDGTISEDDIVESYSEDIPEDYFRAYIFPQLEALRKNSIKIKKYEHDINGRNVVMWQFVK